MTGVQTCALPILGVDVFNITPGDLPVFNGQGGLDEFVKGTELEVGRYLNPRTFGSVSATPGLLVSTNQGGRAPIGVSLTHRTAKGYRFETGYTPRYFLNPPTLAGQSYSPGGQFGAFVIREWRF